MLLSLLWTIGCVTGDDSGKGDESVEMSLACSKYLECVDAVGEDAGVDAATAEDTYGADSTCWANATTANDCTLACQAEVDELLLAYPDEPACGGTGTVADPGAAWDATGVTITSPYELSSGWKLGMVETGAAEGWAGEDCLDSIPVGYEDLLDGGYQICHTLGATGGRLDTVDNPESVVGGSTTLLSQPHEAAITYILWEATSDTCFAWGNDVAYYGYFGCSAL